MKNKKKKFRYVWINQTRLGREFNLSVVTIGKLLIKEGLKDGNTGFATGDILSPINWGASLQRRMI